MTRNEWKLVAARLEDETFDPVFDAIADYDIYGSFEAMARKARAAKKAQQFYAWKQARA